MKARIKRAVGYCVDVDCEDYHKGVFLLNHTSEFFCPRCRVPGFTVHESGTLTGVSTVCKEVRVEFDYDPAVKRFRGLAVVKDVSLDGTHNVYRLESPLIKTEKRALVVAESILGNLNRAKVDGEDPEAGTLAQEFVLNLEAPDFDKALNQLARMWSQGGLGVAS